jgi:PhzF family phenazine biosynthesis protein
MEIFIVDAFTNQLFGGNQAGVVILGRNEAFPEEAVMQKIAAELKHSETAFVKEINPNTFQIRYFTPNNEIELCGHATISSFTVLRNEKKLAPGDYMIHTLAGNYSIIIEADQIWMEMAKGELLKRLTKEESIEIYEALGLHIHDKPEDLSPCIVSTGLSDILLPVGSKENLNLAKLNRNAVIEISKKYNVVGIHMFYYAGVSEATAFCRNFAPLYDIDEEAATGTSNGALTFYLSTMGLIKEKEESIFVQGESMGKPSVIRSRIVDSHTIYIGGNAVISISGKLHNQFQEFITKIENWAQEENAIESIILVGSYARNAQKASSDIDFVIITPEKNRLVEQPDILEQFGVIGKKEIEYWGACTSLRVWYKNSYEVEFGFVEPSWISQPLDGGTHRVLSDGYQVIVDKLGYFNNLVL